MPRLLKTALVLLTFATALTFALTGFTVLNINDEEVAVDDKLPPVASEPKLEGKVLAGQLVFKSNCKSCHSIDQKIVGPALRNAYSRHDEAWLKQWITNSSKMIAAGDPQAVEVFEEFNRMQMTKFSTMKKEDLDALLVYLKHVDSEPIVVP